MADFLLSVGVDVGLSYTEMQKDISALVSQLNSNPPKIKVAFDIDNAAISNLRNQIAEISKTLGTTGAAVKAGSGTSSTAAVNAQIRERITLETEAGRAAAAAAAAKKVADASAEESEIKRQALLKKSYTLLTQMQNAEAKWTAAKSGKSASSYAAIQSDIASLQQWNVQFKSGQITADEFSAKLSSLSSSFTANSNTIKLAGEATQTWGQRLGGLSAKFGTWFSITRVIMAAYRALRQMVTAVTDIDTAMTELKKVTDETDEVYTRFLENAAERAKKLGAALSDVVTASADFARLGFTIDEAEQLADAAIVYKNVGDGIEDISDASESIIATMKAFGVEADDVMSIVDKFNEVGNNYAISSKGVGEALMRSAAAMHSANNTLDETIALATAANTIVQDPEKVGTSLKTISMYLRAAKTEAEDAGESTDGMADSVSELRGEILALTGNKVDIQIDENTFKSTYQILKELSTVWGELSDVSQANILEMIGGKRNSNILAAILENFSVAEKSLETSMNSAGSALEENEKVLESIQGKVSILKASFQDLSNNIIGSDIVKFFVELGTTLINIVNGITGVVNAFGGLKTVLLGVVAALLIAKGGLIAYKIQLLAVAAVQKIITFFSNLKTGIMNIINIIPNAIVAWKAYAAGTISASTAMQASIPVIGLVLSMLTLLVGGIALASDSSEDMSENVEDTSQKLQELAKTAADSSDKIIDLAFNYLEASNALNTLTGTVESYTTARKDLIDGLEIEQTELQKLIDKYGEYDKALASASLSKLKDLEIDLRGGVDTAADKLSDSRKSDIIGNYGAYHGIVTQDNKAIENEILDAFNALKDLPEGLGVVFQKTNVLLNDETDEVKEGYYIFANSVSDAAKDAYGYTTADILHQYEVYKESLKILSDSVGTDNILYKEMYENYSAIKDAAEGFIEARDSLNSNLASQYVLSEIIESGVPRTKTEFDEWRQSIIDAASASGDFSGTLDVITSSIDGVLSQQSQFKGFFDSVANSASNAAKSFTQTLSSVQELSSGFDKLDKIYADVYNKEDFDWGSILNNEEFAETFGFLGDSYTDFIKTISNSSSDINACQEAFNNLAQAYLLNSNVLSGVTAETRNATVAMLKQMGIANAAAIVDSQLAYNKEKLKYTTGDYVDMTYAEIQQLYNECEAGSVTQQVLAELAIAKMMANDNAIKTASDIDQLIALANSANATTQSLANLAKAKEVFAKADALFSQSEATRQAYIKNGNQADGKEWQRLFAEASSLRSKAEAILNTPLEYNKIDADKFKVKYTGGSSTSSAMKSASNAAEKAAKDQETWFEKQLAEHQHLVAMEKETEAEYLSWLSKAYPQAYQEGIIELKDFYKYQEEVFEGLREIFEDKLSDVEHEISMRENYKGEEKKIIALYQGLITDVEREIASARAQGLNDTDDYIQELQKKWQDYTKSIKELREDIEDAAKDALDDLVDYRLDMLKQEIKDEKDALDKKLDNLKEFYDKQKEMLQDKYDEEKYLEDQAEKRKSVSDIKSELAMLEFDDSAWAQKRKLELTEELSEAEKDLSDFEKENALEKALDAIDEAYNSQEAQLQRAMDILDEELNDPNALFNKALEDIKNNSKNQLYYQMLTYNRQFGDGNDETVKKIWEDAYGALNDYEKLFGKLYKDVKLGNETGVKEESGWDKEKISGTNPANKTTPAPAPAATTTKSTAPSLAYGSSVTVKKSATHFSSKSKNAKMASFVPGGSYTVYQTSGDQVLIGRNGVYTGWIKKSDIVGYASGTKHATAGLHELYERGSEALFVSGDGNKYRILNDNDKVLNAKATNFLYDFANSGGGILEQMLKNVLGGTGLDGITHTIMSNEINMGDIIVQGNATERTVSEIRRAQRESVDFMIKEFTRLNK